MQQMSLFDGSTKYSSKKTIRLISLFSGYDSQSLALKYLNLNFEHWKTCEWAVKSIQALKDLHFASDNVDYSKNLTLNEVIDYLTSKGISANYNEPLSQDKIKRLGEDKCRLIYNNIKATHNLVNIQQVHAPDLEIIDADLFDYLLTYSFPCQDLSKAGKCKGMAKGSGTRSGMLWEVERILDECQTNNTLPQILLMENVPDVIGSKNIRHFADWLNKLELLGYKCYWQILNSKDFGIPQNRERCFMVSILGDFYYNFPQPYKLQNPLKNFLEDNVPEKFYLSEKAINGAINTTFNCSKLENKLPKEGIVPTICARDYKDPKCIQVAQLQGNFESTGRVYSAEGLCPTINTCGGGNRESKILELKTKNKRLKSMLNKIDFDKTQAIDMYNQVTHDELHTIKANIDKSNMTAVTQNHRIRKLTPRECFRLMGVKDEDFDKVAANQSNASLYHLAGDSIVVNVLMEIFKNLFMED